jgi:hypothetical protein
VDFFSCFREIQGYFLHCISWVHYWFFLLFIAQMLTAHLNRTYKHKNESIYKKLFEIGHQFSEWWDWKLLMNKYCSHVCTNWDALWPKLCEGMVFVFAWRDRNKPLRSLVSNQADILSGYLQNTSVECYNSTSLLTNLRYLQPTALTINGNSTAWNPGRMVNGELGAPSDFFSEPPFSP